MLALILLINDILQNAFHSEQSIFKVIKYYFHFNRQTLKAAAIAQAAQEKLQQQQAQQQQAQQQAQAQSQQQSQGQQDTTPAEGELQPGGATSEDSATPVVADWTYDPNEPRYCLCNQVSYGEMVGCDNPNVSTHVYIYTDSTSLLY